MVYLLLSGSYCRGRGKTKEEAIASLKDAIELILEDRREEGLKGVHRDAIREVITLE